MESRIRIKNKMDGIVIMGYFYKWEHHCKIRIFLLDHKTPYLSEHMAEINKLTVYYGFSLILVEY